MSDKDFISEPIMDFQNECDDGGTTYLHLHWQVPVIKIRIFTCMNFYFVCATVTIVYYIGQVLYTNYNF